MKRRDALSACAALVVGSSPALPASASARTTASLAALLRVGACVVVLRHAQTDPGIGDPPNFRLDLCSSQRNLSPDGQAQARSIGQWFIDRQLKARAVQTSPWCRCKDTAELAFGRYTVLPALASTFDDRSAAIGHTQTLRALLQNVPPGQFEVWVSHQVNITSLTGEVPTMGEAFIVGKHGKILARTSFE